MVITTNTPPNHPVDSFEVLVAGNWYTAYHSTTGGSYDENYSYDRVVDGENYGRSFVRYGTTWVILRNVDGAPDGYSDVSVADHPWEAFPNDSYRKFKVTNAVNRTRFAGVRTIESRFGSDGGYLYPANTVTPNIQTVNGVKVFEISKTDDRNFRVYSNLAQDGSTTARFKKIITTEQLRMGKQRVTFDVTLNGSTVASDIANFMFRMSYRDDQTNLQPVVGSNTFEFELYDDGQNDDPEIYFAFHQSSAYDISISNLKVVHNYAEITLNRTAPVIDSDRKGESRPLLGKLVGGAKAAYSLRDLNDRQGNNKVVRVRRASDNHERDFSAKECRNGTLQNWVNSQAVLPLDVKALTADGRTGSTSSAKLAFSLRNLSSSYTGYVVEVVKQTTGRNTRSFKASEITDGTLLDWVGTGSAFVSKWYDQSGNDNHAVQSGDNADRPTIVENGNLVQNTAALLFNGDAVLNLTSSLYLSTDVSIFTVVYSEYDEFDILGSDGQGTGSFGLMDTETYHFTNEDGTNEGTLYSAVSTNNFNLLSAIYAPPAGQSERYITAFGNGVTGEDIATTSDAMELMTIGDGGVGTPLEGLIKEIIVYDSDQTENRDAIEANIADTYNIPNMPTALDEVDGFVERWYDQSGNGNDAIQSSSTDQPRIVDEGNYIEKLEFEHDFFDISPVTAKSVFAVMSANTALTGSGNLHPIVSNVNTGGKSYIFISNNHSTFASYAISIDGHASQVADVGSWYLNGTFKGSGTNLGTFGDIVSAQTMLQTIIYTTADDPKTTVNTIGRQGATGKLFGTFKELIIYDDDQSANRPAIEANINNQYEIYP